MMIGGELATPVRGEEDEAGSERLTVRNLSLESEHPFGTPIRDVSLTVRAGEILGIAGVAGNGQPELLAALSGETLCPQADAIVLDGRSVGRLGPRARRARGVCVVPEERLGQGTVPEMTLSENGFLSAYLRSGMLRQGLLQLRAMSRFATDIIEAYSVMTPGPAAAAGSLSGGNLQKFIIGREILQDPDILIAAHPTWGVDAGAAAAIQQALLDLARAGAAVLVISRISTSCSRSATGSR